LSSAVVSLPLVFHAAGWPLLSSPVCSPLFGTGTAELVACFLPELPFEGPQRGVRNLRWPLVFFLGFTAFLDGSLKRLWAARQGCSDRRMKANTISYRATALAATIFVSGNLSSSRRSLSGARIYSQKTTENNLYTLSPKVTKGPLASVPSR